MLDSNKKYEIVFAQAFRLWIEQKIKYISIRIVELLNIKLKFKQVSKALLIYMIDQHDKIYLADIGECNIEINKPLNYLKKQYSHHSPVNSY